MHAMRVFVVPWLAVASLIAAAPLAQAEPLGFQLLFRPPKRPNDGLPRAPMPAMGAVSRQVPVEVADQLDEAARRVIARDPSLRGLVPKRTGAVLVDWALDVTHDKRE